MMVQPELLYILAHTTLFTDGRIYVILKIGLEQGGCIIPGLGERPMAFWAYMRDADEATLVLDQGAFEQLPSPVTVLDVSPPYRLITFDISLGWEVVGYLAKLTAVLADLGISIFALSAFSRDHLFVAEVDFDRAWEALDAFIRTCREQVDDFKLYRESV